MRVSCVMHAMGNNVVLLISLLCFLPCISLHRISRWTVYPKTIILIVSLPVTPTVHHTHYFKNAATPSFHTIKLQYLGPLI